MTRLEELELAIESLPENEYSQLRQWFLERDWARWDQEIEADSMSGKLDFLVKEAQDARAKGTLKDPDASGDGCLLADPALGPWAQYRAVNSAMSSIGSRFQRRRNSSCRSCSQGVSASLSNRAGRARSTRADSVIRMLSSWSRRARSTV